MKNDTKFLFDDYLRQVHADQAEGVLDDDMPDNFDYWLAGLEGNDFIELANKAMQVQAEKHI